MTPAIYEAAIWTVLFLVATAAAGLLAVALRRRLPLLGNNRRLALVERLELGERRFLALVRIDDRELLVGVGPQGIAVLESETRRSPRDPGEALAATRTPTASQPDPLPGPVRSIIQSLRVAAANGGSRS